MFGGLLVLALAACPSSEALTAQVRAATAGDVDVDARIVDDTVHVVVVARGDTTVERTLDVATADCRTLPDLVAVVARRALSALPQTEPVSVVASPTSSPSPTSDHASPTSSPSPTSDQVQTLQASATPAQTFSVLGRVTFGAGLGLAAGGDARLGVGLRLPIGVFVVDVGVEVDGGLPQHLGAGYLWSGAALATGRLGVQIDVGSIGVVPFVGASAGGLFVAGRGNVEDARAATFFGRLAAGLAVDVGDVEVGLAGEVSPHVVLRAGTATTSLPGTRLVATAAWTFSLD
jgi:hypothetical protein